MAWAAWQKGGRGSWWVQCWPCSKTGAGSLVPHGCGYRAIQSHSPRFPEACMTTARLSTTDFYIGQMVAGTVDPEREAEFVIWGKSSRKQRLCRERRGSGGCRCQLEGRAKAGVWSESPVRGWAGSRWDLALINQSVGTTTCGVSWFLPANHPN